MKRYPGPYGPHGEYLTFSVIHCSSPSCLREYGFSSALETSMGPIPSLTFPIDSIDLEFL